MAFLKASIRRIAPILLGVPRAFPNLAPDDDAADRFAAAMRPLSPAPLSREKAREGLGNLLEFVGLLERWDAEDRRRGDAAAPADQAPAPGRGAR